jgi:hypothetical protein
VRVPLIEHPSEIFLSQQEDAAVRLIIQHDKTGESPVGRNLPPVFSMFPASSLDLQINQ